MLATTTPTARAPPAGGLVQVLSATAAVQGRLGDEEEREARRAAILTDMQERMTALGDITKPKHVISFLNDVAYKTVGGQQLSGSCMFCNTCVKSTGATRVVDHFIMCMLCPTEVKTLCQGFRTGTLEKRKEKEEHEELVVAEQQHAQLVLKKQKTELQQQGIKAGFSAAEATAADQAIAKFFYANAISFAAADAAPDSYYREMVRAIKAAPAGYRPPTKNAIGGRLLDTSHTDMLRDVEKRDTDGEQSDKFGVAYTSDGWDSCDNLPLINSAYILANDGGVYQRSVDTSGSTKSAEYCAALMIVDIYDIGCTKVILVLTDTCAVMQKAWTIAEDEFSWISCAPCQTHCPSLLLTDVVKLPEPAAVVKEENIIVTWISNHQKPLAIFREKMRALFPGKSKELKKAGATRMGTNTFVGERLSEVKPCLQATMVDPEYMKQGYKDAPATAETSNCETITRENKGGMAKKLVMDDNGFWQRVDNHVAMTMPICKFLRRHDTSAPATGKVYHGWYELGEHIKDSSVPYAKNVTPLHERRWAYAHCSFFAAGCVVDPEFVGHNQASNAEVMEGFNETVEKLAILLKVRSEKEKYEEQWAKRRAAINADEAAQGKWDDYPTYPTSTDKDVKEFCAAASTQLTLYRGKKGVFAREWIMEAVKGMPGYLWWDQHGATVPELQTVSRMILAQPGSASICERINSEFEFVKDRRRNKLSHEKADKLVSLFHNLRLLKHMEKPKYSEPMIAWGDADEVDVDHSRVIKFKQGSAGAHLQAHPSC